MHGIGVWRDSGVSRDSGSAEPRQAEGIALAKAAGNERGQARTLTADQLAQARAQIAAGVPKAKIARDLDVDRTMLYRTLAADPDSP